MDSKEFKKKFGDVAKANEFKSAYGGWYKESTECTAVIELQKSNFGNYYQLNIKIFINGIFDRAYPPSKDLIKSSLGHINSNETQEYKSVLDFDIQLNDIVRIRQLEELFKNHIVPFVDRTSTRLSIRELELKGEIFLLPAVKEELEKLMVQ